MSGAGYLLPAAVLSTLAATSLASPVVTRSSSSASGPADLASYAGQSVWRLTKGDGFDVETDLLELAKVCLNP